MGELLPIVFLLLAIGIVTYFYLAISGVKKYGVNLSTEKAVSMVRGFLNRPINGGSITILSDKYDQIIEISRPESEIFVKNLMSTGDGTRLSYESGVVRDVVATGKFDDIGHVEKVLRELCQTPGAEGGIRIRMDHLA